MSELLKYYYTIGSCKHLPPFDSQPITQYETNKIYIGELPLTIDDFTVRETFAKFTHVLEVRIIKGDSRGHFSRSCYAFTTLRADEQTARAAIKKVQEICPHWKMNIKLEEKGRYNPLLYQNEQRRRGLEDGQQILGEKKVHIMVREIWLGGIPEMSQQPFISQVMAQFGKIEKTQIFPKFAFIRFKIVLEATLAFERANQISQAFGNPPGFRIFFSDPVRRANIVSNNYQFDRNSPYLPILFLGFPPVTSATIDLELMRGICQRFGRISNAYMRKNSNNQTRSYMLLTYEDMKSALQAKIELNRKRDILGDKRVEITLLLDQNYIMRGRDFSYTQKMYQGINDKKRDRARQHIYEPVGPYGPHQGNPQYPMMYQPIMPGYSPFVPFYPPRGMYSMPPENENNQQGESKEKGEDMMDFLSSMIDDKIRQQQDEAKPTKKPGKQENTSEIISKILGNENNDAHKDQNRQPSWSGFLTWKSSNRVGVDGHSEECEIDDYIISIMYTITPENIVVKDKQLMVLEATDKRSEQIFNQYTRKLRQKVGVSISHQLFYVIGKSKKSDQLRTIEQNQLLVVIEKANLVPQIKDKLEKIEALQDL